MQGRINQAAAEVYAEDRKMPFENEKKMRHTVIEIPVALLRPYTSSRSDGRSMSAI